MRVLGLDTATRVASVALVEDERVVWERSSQASPGHGRMLARLVEEAFHAAGWLARDLTRVAVSIGPGSFTGLRIGLGLAKGLAYAARASVVPVPTLSALAAVAPADPGDLVCPMLDARKGEVYGALFEARGHGTPAVLQRPALARPQEILDSLDGRRCWVLGDGGEVHATVVQAAAPRGAMLLPFSHYHPQGGMVARLAMTGPAIAAGQALAELEPTYVRPSYAAAAAGEPRAVRD